jgi:hypothetical protein
MQLHIIPTWAKIGNRVNHPTTARAITMTAKIVAAFPPHHSVALADLELLRKLSLAMDYYISTLTVSSTHCVLQVIP